MCFQLFFEKYYSWNKKEKQGNATGNINFLSKWTKQLQCHNQSILIILNPYDR